ncbi:MAG TPA: ATP-binding protein [Planctomycetaceae bacterium]|nr:ATP-binding protein [Planctomycetaceae bacterium]
MAVDSELRDEPGRLRERYDEIAQLAGGLAHEIKNPLSTISMHLELLVEDLDGAKTQRDRRMLTKIQTVQRECRHLQGILEDFLKFARVGEGELDLAECDLNQVVQDFIDFYQAQARGQGIDISPHLGTDLPAVRLDPALFRQVLLNLALNAQQAMPSGGLLELQTCLRDDRVQLDVIDNGVGMDERTLGKLFQAFFSTKPGGSGLGLPTVRKIVEAHGGSITVQSEKGKGTRFSISLPPAG